MAIAIDNSGSTGSSSSGTTVTLSFTVSGSDRILYALVGDPAGGTCSGVTYNNSVAMTQIDSASNGYSQWYLIAPTTGTNDIVATFSTSGIYRCISAVSITGAAQSAQPHQYANDTFKNDSTDRGASVTTTVDGCAVFSAGGMDNGGFVAGDANATLVTNGGYSATKIIGIVRTTTFPQTSAGAVVPLFDGAANSWGIGYTVAFAPATAGATVNSGFFAFMN